LSPTGDPGLYEIATKENRSARSEGGGPMGGSMHRGRKRDCVIGRLEKGGLSIISGERLKSPHESERKKGLRSLGANVQLAGGVVRRHRKKKECFDSRRGGGSDRASSHQRREQRLEVEFRRWVWVNTGVPRKIREGNAPNNKFMKR